MSKENSKNEIESPAPGVFITKGMNITVPSFSIWINDDGTFGADPLIIHTGLDMSPYWLEIALIHLFESEKAHSILMEGKKENDSEKIAAALHRDFIAGMQVIMACATSIEAYYASIKNHIFSQDEILASGQDKSRHKSRYKQITELFQIAFDFTESSTDSIREIFRQIFEIRNRAVHPRSGTNAPVLHPELNMVSDWRFSEFRNYNAKAIVKVTLQMFDKTCSKGNFKTKELENYCKDLYPKIEPLIGRWEAVYGSLY